MKRDHAFTLVELLVVMGLIAVVAGFGITALSLSQRGARDEDRKNTVAQMQGAIDSYFRVNTRYPNEEEVSWSPTAFTISGGTSVLLEGTKQYSSGATSANSTHYTYLKDPSGYRICVQLEGGTWYSLGNALAQCPAT